MNDKPAGGLHLCKASPDQVSSVGSAQPRSRGGWCTVSYFTEELVNIPPGPSAALCLGHITSCRSGPSPESWGEQWLPSLSWWGSCSRRAGETGEPRRGRAAGTEKGEWGDKTPPKYHLVRLGEIKPDTYSDQWQKRKNKNKNQGRHIMWEAK